MAARSKLKNARLAVFAPVYIAVDIMSVYCIATQFSCLLVAVANPCGVRTCRTSLLWRWKWPAPASVIIDLHTVRFQLTANGELFFNLQVRLADIAGLVAESVPGPSSSGCDPATQLVNASNLASFWNTGFLAVTVSHKTSLSLSNKSSRLRFCMDACMVEH